MVATLAVVLLLRGYQLLRTDADVGLSADEVLYLNKSARERAGSQSALMALSYKLVPKLRSALPRNAVRWLQQQVDMAGRPKGLDVDSVLAKFVMWGLVLTPIFVIGVLRGELLYIVLPVVIVGILPLAQLSGMARKRREAIDRDLPDFLDVLAVTVSAGLGFRSALSTVADRFGGAISDEITTVLHQITNGASVRSAFAAMRDRTRSEPVNEFVTAYLQAEELGAPLADTLNQIAADIRRGTAQRMRQRASKIEPRISLVMTMVLIPGALVILVGGMVLAMGADQLGGMFGG
ncbi:membrane protein [Knoellia subterranea KCTC 19937]|uniref:Membrane protein n=1 Tax=Knoellia subterranea KCTC 19937 TaxID=1385521 RepID=A0A0A0JQJ7_9MICO|nr:membrane protein [Knoellia subterranea KCTC 19937]